MGSRSQVEATYDLLQGQRRGYPLWDKQAQPGGSAYDRHCPVEHGCAIDLLDKEGCEKDLEWVKRVLTRRGEYTKARLDELRHKARAYTHIPYWGVIVAVAKEAVERRKLTGREIVRTILDNWSTFYDLPVKARPLKEHYGG